MKADKKMMVLSYPFLSVFICGFKSSSALDQAREWD
jgi:hypothetical protein